MNWISRKTYASYFYILFLVFLVVRYIDGLFLTELVSNPIRSPRVDLIVWITQWLDIPNLMSTSLLSTGIDIAIVILPIVILYRLFKDQTINRLVLTLCIFFGLYILIIYCFPTLSIRKYLGLVLIPIAFTFSTSKRYYSYLELMRYYILFVFTSASLWKIFRGVALDTNHMQLSLKAQHIDNLVNYPSHHVTDLVSTFIHDPVICSMIFLLAILFQLSFGIGFFTKKYDKALAIFLIIFIISDYLVMKIEYWEFLVFLPLLLGSYPSATEGITTQKTADSE